MLKVKKSLTLILTVLLASMIATPCFARTISFKDAGVALWIFIIVGAIIVLLLFYWDCNWTGFEEQEVKRGRGRRESHCYWC